MNLYDIQSPIRDELAAVRSRMGDLLADGILGDGLAEELSGSADAEGLHASLLLLTAHALGGITGTQISLAVGCELFGLATSIHDAVLNEKNIEGWPRERMIIDGDHIFSAGLTLLTRGPALSSNIVAEMIERMALGGLEYVREDRDTSPERHIGMLRDKYGALFGASCELAALNGRISGDRVIHLRDYGRSLGTAYKIGDEILNLAEAVRSGRATLPILYATDSTGLIQSLLRKRDAERLVALCSSNGGFREAKARASELSDRALSVLSASGVDSQPMRQLCSWVGGRIN